MLRVTDNLGAEVQYTYNSIGKRTSEKRRINGEEKQLVKFLYDETGRLVDRAEKLNQKRKGTWWAHIHYTYDANSNITEIKLPDDSKIQREYEAVDRLVAETVIDSATGQQNTTRFAYDKAGNLLTITDDCGREERFTYNLMNQRIIAVSSEGRTQKLVYDKEGNITERQLPQAMSYRYQYDSAGRLTAVIGTDGKLLETVAYDFAGNITEADDGKRIKFQDRNGITNEYQWNVYGSLVERKAGDLRNSYGYAPNGQLTAAIADGMDYRYTYDKDGLLLAKKASGRTLLAYTYDELGRKTSQTDITGRKVNYRFDKSNRLVDIRNEVDQSIVKFERDADGAIEKIPRAEV